MLVGIAKLQPEGDTARISAVVGVHFAPDSLIKGVVQHLSSSAQPEVFDELYAWLLADSIRGIEMKADSAAASQSLQEYAQQLQTRRPSPERIQMAARFAEVQNASEFYVRYITSLQKAALEVARAAGKGVPDISNPTDEEWAEAVQQFSQVAVVSFLQRLEPLKAEEISRLTEAYESRSGRWYVDAYSDAIGATLEAAGRKAAARRPFADLGRCEVTDCTGPSAFCAPTPGPTRPLLRSRIGPGHTSGAF